MDGFKRKKVESDKKISNSSNKPHKGVKKRTRKKQKKKEANEKLFKNTNWPIFFKQGKDKINEKASKKIEGMFFKGLRSDYVTRQALNEANKARKNEDINAIIDIGKALFQKEENLGKCSKRLHGSKTEGEKSGSTEELEDCPLSPISNVTAIGDILRTKKTKLDLELEFEMFSQKYEAIVGKEILQNLPKNGVLEDALNALRKKQKTKQTVRQEFLRDETHFSKEFKFSTEDFESRNPPAEDFINKFIFSDNLLVPETDYYYGDSLEPMKTEQFMLDDDFQDCNRLTFEPVENSENLLLPVSEERGFENPGKDLTITTPPIQFYRRNMF